MTEKQLGRMVLLVLMLALFVAFITAFASWSKTWGWEWYGYTMFYTGIIFVLLTPVALAELTDGEVSIWQILGVLFEVGSL